MKLSRNPAGKDDSDDGLDSRENTNNLAKILLSAAIISVTFYRNIYSSVTDHKLSRTSQAVEFLSFKTMRTRELGANLLCTEYQ